MKYTKTPAGQLALKERHGILVPRLRSAFILFDGQRTTMDVLLATHGMGVTQDDIDSMVGLGLLAPAPDQAPAPPQIRVPALPEYERYQRAYPMASQLAGSLGLRGYRLSLAVEAATEWSMLEALIPQLRDAVGRERFEPLRQTMTAF